MSYGRYYGSYVPYWIRKGAKTVDEVAAKENGIIQKPFSLAQLNSKMKKRGWKGPKIPDTLSNEEKELRQKRTRKLRENMVRYAAGQLFEIRKAKNIIRQQQLAQGITEDKIETATGLRYVESLLFDFSGAELAASNNAAMQQTFIEAVAIGTKMKQEGRTEKTPQELEVEKKFNDYHEAFFKRISNYPLEEIGQHVNDDDYLVEHFKQIIEASNLVTQYENIKKAYKDAHIDIPQSLRETMEGLKERLAKVNTLELRLQTIESPYYSILDIDNFTTTEIFTQSLELDEIAMGEPDVAHPMWKEEEGREKNSEFKAFYNSVCNFANVYYNDEMLALQEVSLKMGILPENLMVQIGDAEPVPFYCDENHNTYNVTTEMYTKLFKKEISKISFFDKSEDPPRRMELSGDVKRDYHFCRLWSEYGKIPAAKMPVAPKAPREPIEPKPPVKPELKIPEKPPLEENNMPIKYPKPRFYKRILNTLFGAYKTENDNYKGYVAGMAAYLQKKESNDKILSDHKKEVEKITAKYNDKKKKYDQELKAFPGRKEEYEKQKAEYETAQKEYPDKVEAYNKALKEYRDAVSGKKLTSEQFRFAVENAGMKAVVTGPKPALKQPAEVKNDPVPEQPKEEVKLEEQPKAEQPVEESPKTEKTLTDRNLHNVKRTEVTLKEEKVDISHMKRPDLTDGVRSWGRGANWALRNNKNGRPAVIAAMGLTAFRNVSNKLDRIISSADIPPYIPPKKTDKVEEKNLPPIPDKLEKQKISAEDVFRMGIYQMFYGEDGTFDQKVYQILKDDKVYKGPDSLEHFKEYIKEKNSTSTEEITYAKFVEKMRKKEPIIPKTDQEKLLSDYAAVLETKYNEIQNKVNAPQKNSVKADNKEKMENPILNANKKHKIQ